MTILDLTHMLSGPYATMLLADLGARMIKVEPPGRGEATRRLLEHSPQYSRSGMGAYFLTLNRNKQSVAIDLKTPAGLDLFYGMVAAADVVVTNFGAGVTERLRIDHARLEAVNPRIISCAITGFGETGPFPDRPAFDLVAQGMGGGMSLTGHADDEPLRAGIPIGDLGGGLFAVIGILSALQARQTTGRGQHIDISMFDVQLSLLNYMGTMYLMSGEVPGRNGNGHFVHVPYDTFRTQTRHLIIAVLTDRCWADLAALLGDEKLLDPAFATQPGRLAYKDLLVKRIQACLERETCEHWLEALGKAKVPAAPVNDIGDALADPQGLARQMRVSVPLRSGGSVDQPGNPVKLSETYEDVFTPPPPVGFDTAAVLGELLLLDTQAISALAAEGAIGLHP